MDLSPPFSIVLFSMTLNDPGFFLYSLGPSSIFEVGKAKHFKFLTPNWTRQMIVNIPQVNVVWLRDFLILDPSINISGKVESSLPGP